jgi:predicted nucleic acid-binding protein
MKGRVICNASPIIALCVIGRVDLLRRLFEAVIVPEEVHREILEGGSEFAGLRVYEKSHWVKVMRISKAVDPLLATLLDQGEGAVIELARELNPEFVLIDELKARKIARKIYGLKVIGSARILVEAKREGLLNNVSKELKGMREAGYWLSDAIVEATLRQAEES